MNGFKNYIKDHVRLLKSIYKLSLIVALKSPTNLWMASLTQVVYYIGQVVFWIGLKNTEAGASLLSTSQLILFLVTVAFVDNAYLFIFGQGSLLLPSRVENKKLDNILLIPRDSLRLMSMMNPNWSFFPCFVLSVLAFGGIHLYYQSPLHIVGLHFLASLLGVWIMNGISFLFRITVFWSETLPKVRNANPSYKIMVRPYGAFSEKARWVLLTIFPALCITGIPAEIANQNLPSYFIVFSLFGSVCVWVAVNKIYKMGLKLYNTQS